MANIGENAISILAGNLNSGRSYLITAVFLHFWQSRGHQSASCFGVNTNVN